MPILLESYGAVYKQGLQAVDSLLKQMSYNTQGDFFSSRRACWVNGSGG